MELFTFEILNKITKIDLCAAWYILLVLIWGYFVFHYSWSAFVSSVTEFFIDGA